MPDMRADHADLLSPWRWPHAAYIHIPFCAHQCGYCDFAVAAGQDHLIDLYLEALELELATLGQPAPIRTLFVGGGTPTQLRPRQLERLFASLRHWLPPRGPDNQPDAGPSAAALAPWDECSVESTPDSLDAERVEVLAAAGVNRISIGVQTFQDHLLPVLDRVHDAGQIPAAVQRAGRRIPHVSLDLIFGIPGQTIDDWQTDLDKALAFQPQHLSTYGLTYEKGTPLWKQRLRGQVRPVTEELERRMYLAAIERLEAGGFEHYEISNFARPGCRCRHNETYWANEAYFGFGVGAARYVLGKRELNTRSTHDYLRRVLAGESPTFQSEELPPQERARETFAVQLRRTFGIDRDRFRQQTGYELDGLIGAKLRGHVAEGYLADDGTRVRLTRQGQCVADAIIEELL